MRLSMDEIINAVCLNIAERKGIQPTDVTVQLAWEEDTGYTAEVWAQGRSQYLIESNLIEAILRYMFSEYDARVFREQVELIINDDVEEIQAIIHDN
ncbi:YxcD family protein [Paenibacillus wulumuqiensis]|uniref:YxcD family protein n=1 Tax=Paenibacillus wulumuqiensis TaxID=1567107 RepID=UPI000619FFE0|nr:YxcD family protein [Paenibacillus wulumuqiensis]